VSFNSYQKRVLHVDGQWKTHAIVKDLVDRACPDCELITVESGTEALRRAKTEPFDLVIVDPWASEVTGFEICRYLAANKPNIPVFFYAQQKLMNDRKFAEAAGAAAFFLRDNNDQLVEALESALA